LPFFLESPDQRHRLVHPHPAVCHPTADGGQLRPPGRHPQGRRRVPLDAALLSVPDRPGGEQHGLRWGGTRWQPRERFVFFYSPPLSVLCSKFDCALKELLLIFPQIFKFNLVLMCCHYQGWQYGRLICKWSGSTIFLAQELNLVPACHSYMIDTGTEITGYRYRRYWFI
jgi:hypothetical protein